ncbi:MAG: thermonuclease family protein [Dehalococcoidia bacterium]
MSLGYRIAAIVGLVIVALAAHGPAVSAQAPEGWQHVARVIDGDTVELDDGTRVRLFGVSAPELNQRCGPEARDVLAGMLADRERGNNVYLEYGPRQLDDFDRTLGYLWVNDGGEDWSLIDEWLVLLGYGEAWTDDGQYRDRIVVAEEQAVRDGAGCLWAGRSTPAATAAPVAPPPPPSNCHPSYPTVCLPYPPDLDCGQISARRFAVLPPDPHRLDADNDGIGCESG